MVDNAHLWETFYLFYAFFKTNCKRGVHVRQIDMYKWLDNNVYNMKVFTQQKNDPVHHSR